jgi:hypothetical protein
MCASQVKSPHWAIRSPQSVSFHPGGTRMWPGKRASPTEVLGSDSGESGSYSAEGDEYEEQPRDRSSLDSLRSRGSVAPAGLLAPDRPFVAVAGAAEVVAAGTQFDVRLEHDSTVVTVVERRVAVGPSPMAENLGTDAGQDHASRIVRVSANQQTSVAGERGRPHPSVSTRGARPHGCIDKFCLTENRCRTSLNSTATLRGRSRSLHPR